MIQTLIVTLIVMACGAYALWVLMPSALRRVLATQALRWPMPAALAARLQRAVQPASGCGSCGDCGPKPAKGAAQPIRFHPRARP